MPISGNAANVINGREGADVLTGQGGADTFMFDRTASNENADRITDFTHDVDRITFVRSAFSGLTPGVLAADAFVQGTTSADTGDRVIYDGTTGRLWFDADGLGGADQVLVAVLANRALLSATDIFVI